VARLIDAYLSEFDRYLAFDRQLARRVREEVGTHLAEIVEHQGTEAEAVARFGDPKQLSKAFAESALPRRLQTAVFSLAVMSALTFAMMRFRSLWFDLSANQDGLAGYLTMLDRTGFFVGVATAIYVYWVVRKTPLQIDRAITAIHVAMLLFAISISASLARAITVASADGLVWFTAAIEFAGFVMLYRQQRQSYRHAMIARSLV
jgi:hypothetical protein